MSRTLRQLFWLQVACAVGVLCGVANWFLDPADISDNFNAVAWPAVAFVVANSARRLAEALQ